MFLTIQFPLFDNRFYQADPKRNPNPNWAKHHKRARIRYFGEIADRKGVYIGPYDDEKQYCTADGVFNFCGLKPGDFFPTLYNDKVQTRILFRRFQSDGKFMAKFELGFNDLFEETIASPAPGAGEAKKLIMLHLQKYLLCPVKIKIGRKLSKFTPLAEAGNELRSAYFWASTSETKTFDFKSVAQQVENSEPVILIQIDPTKINLADFESSRIEMDELKTQGIDVYNFSTPYNIGRRRYQVKTWMIAVKKTIGTLPILPGDFKYYNPMLRNLRINLLRINTETFLQHKILSDLSGESILNDQSPAQQVKQVTDYLHKIFLNLSKSERNAQSQQPLIDAAFKLEEKYMGPQEVNDRLAAYDKLKVWLNNLQPNGNNQLVKDQVIKNESAMLHQQSEAAKKKRVFISYNHHDAATAENLRTRLDAEGIDTILDSDDMLAGTSIAKFIDQSIRNSDATILIASKKSLLSGWVSIESIKGLMVEGIYGTRKFIAGYLDKSFTKKGFVTDAAILIQKRIDEIVEELQQRNKLRIASPDLDAEKDRLIALQKDLPFVVAKLNDKLSMDLGKKEFEKSFEKLVRTINS